MRSFLQVRGKVCKGIQQTIEETPHRFLAYNNGLTATARELDLEDRKHGHFRLVAATDFQIVKGGQTTASLYHAWKKDKQDISQVAVQMKLTLVADHTKLGEFVPLISLYANSQNKVNTTDFSVHGPFHQKLEKLSRTVWAPAIGGLERGTRWYYERARGSYLDDKSRAGTPAQVRRGKASSRWSRSSRRRISRSLKTLGMSCRISSAGARKRTSDFGRRDARMTAGRWWMKAISGSSWRRRCFSAGPSRS